MIDLPLYNSEDTLLFFSFHLNFFLLLDLASINVDFLALQLTSFFQTFQLVFTIEMILKLIAFNKLFYQQPALLSEMVITLITLCELVWSWVGSYDFTGYSLLRLVKLVR